MELGFRARRIVWDEKVGVAEGIADPGMVRESGIECIAGWNMVKGGIVAVGSLAEEEEEDNLVVVDILGAVVVGSRVEEGDTSHLVGDTSHLVADTEMKMESDRTG